jgi:catechol 2,3-dioxygenase-like lactoylglutathione lyase family enzyme
MGNSESRLVNVCPVFVSKNVQETVKFYTEKLGFWSAGQYDKAEAFAALYRDDIEIIIVQAKKGPVESHLQRNGAGYDAYIDPASPEGILQIYEEFQSKGVKIISEPQTTAYGTFEFVFEDGDGRRIGVGRIRDKAEFFKDSPIHPG